ncbi:MULTISPECIES: response regulator transcription factor [unclassified Enterococcus]|uniref:response regulator transcription factor n=1 Tax=unclassified Enterococcus TaxID=2608891 RepID=UPI001CE03D6C|nr:MULTISPECIES: response regulator transcription factor [unclassified Enterococcus]MCA5013895.1 response regulator transcription factor [Enterococcus sp. S23]MCA5017331.1 response regulator transcription factor [Enterococcus sp. S22(2020)]
MNDVVILLVEDEASLANFISEELRFEGYEVLYAADGEQALTLYEENQERITMLLLDWMLPKYDGITVARRIRRNSQVPIIMMTARDQLTDKVVGLDAGTDDYITKPFEIEELLARIRVIIRRTAQAQVQSLIYSYNDLMLDLTKRVVERFGESIQLTQKEFELLAELIKRPEEVLTRDELLNAVWGYDYFGQTNVVDVYIRSLRNKMDYEVDQRLIQTVRGVGYVLRKKS